MAQRNVNDPILITQRKAIDKTHARVIQAPQTLVRASLISLGAISGAAGGSFVDPLFGTAIGTLLGGTVGNALYKWCGIHEHGIPPTSRKK